MFDFLLNRLVNNFFTGTTFLALQDTTMTLIKDTVLILLGIVFFLNSFSIKALQYFTTMRLGTIVEEAWQNSIFLVNVFAIIIILAIALANALRINVETYQIKKTLPSLIAGIILANFSLLLVRAVLDLNDIIVQYLITYGGQNGGSDNLYANLMSLTTGIKMKMAYGFSVPDLGSLATDLAADSSGPIAVIVALVFAGVIAGAVTNITEMLVAALLVVLVMITIPTIILLLLMVISMARYVILFILVVLSPLAILAYFFPPTKSLGQKWLNSFLQWSFMPSMIFFILNLATFFGPKGQNINSGESLFQEGSTPTDSISDKVFNGIVRYLAGLVILYAALYIPTRISGVGSEIMQAWNGFITKTIPQLAKPKATLIAEQIGKNRPTLGNMMKRPAMRKEMLANQIKATSSANELRLVNTTRASMPDNETRRSLDKRARQLTFDAVDKYKNDPAENLISWFETKKGKEAYDHYRKGEYGAIDSDDYEDVVGRLNALKIKSQNTFDPGYQKSKSFMDKDWHKTNLDFGPGPRPLDSSNSNIGANNNILNHHFDSGSIEEAIQTGDKTKLKATGPDGKAVPLPWTSTDPKDAKQISDLEKTITEEAQKTYKMTETDPTDPKKKRQIPNTKVPRNLDGVFNDYRDQREKSVNEKAAHFSSIALNSPSGTPPNHVFTKIAEEVENGRQENAIQLAKDNNMEYLESSIKEAGTDKNSLNNYVFRKAMLKHTEAPKNIQSDIGAIATRDYGGNTNQVQISDLMNEYQNQKKTETPEYQHINRMNNTFNDDKLKNSNAHKEAYKNIQSIPPNASTKDKFEQILKSANVNQEYLEKVVGDKEIAREAANIIPPKMNDQQFEQLWTKLDTPIAQQQNLDKSSLQRFLRTAPTQTEIEQKVGNKDIAIELASIKPSEIDSGSFDTVWTKIEQPITQQQHLDKTNLKTDIQSGKDATYFEGQLGNNTLAQEVIKIQPKEMDRKQYEALWNEIENKGVKDKLDYTMVAFNPAPPTPPGGPGGGPAPTP